MCFLGLVGGCSGLGDMSLGTASSGGSDISLGSMGSTPGGMAGGSFPFGNMGPTDMSGMGMGLPTSMGMDGTYASNDAHNQNGIGGLPMSSHDTDVSSHRESLGSLGQLPRNFSLSDLTAELTNSAGQYCSSPSCLRVLWEEYCPFIRCLVLILMVRSKSTDMFLGKKKQFR